MDKTEMYNKVINAIDVLSGVQGETVEIFDVTFNWESFKTIKYRLGNIHILKRKKEVKLFINGMDVTDKVDRVDVIHRKLLDIYEKQRKNREEGAYELVKVYLNSFVGK